ncbi:protein-L-isoaspartate O-methyltransferase [Sphingomonas canadensis]|uniref:Protein-L-isoaspartate O-methyltransferase n=1 Tax=Sphingomonas canadensis TaxID=1219257 RepID=A0ABW3H9M3_9SPHN|nr:protein-L-isoaspartate O-methyltransferase [Sphingomonas canadensis]MCW3838018.1 protein-L-isoaspartate O-methyltransferase [Sphingomonas canadensis]
MMALSVQTAPAPAGRFEAMRRAMVSSQLRTNAVNDARVVAAMADVPREEYLPEEARAIAYRDTLLPLPGGRSHNSPLATGRLITEARVGAGDRVLLVGAAGGYSAAVLAKLGAAVTALEEDAGLVALARQALEGQAGVEVAEGPLAAGWAAGAPYDVLMIDGAVEAIPDALLAQLRPGARVVAGVVDRGVTRLASGRKTEGGFGLVHFADLEAARLPGFAKPVTFTF